MTLHDDPEMRRRIATFYDTVWHRLSERIELARRAGADWYRVSTPFVALEGDVVVAHVGVIEIALVLDGVPTTVAGIHAVGTHPEHRRRGHAGRLLAQALAYADQRFDVAQLTTEVPAVFRASGFRSLPQTRFVVPLPPRRMTSGLRRLSIDDRDDLALLHQKLRTRTALSQVLGVVEPGWLFVIDEVLSQRGLERVHYAADLDALIVFEEGTAADNEGHERIKLLDVVASTLPPLDEVLRRLPAGSPASEVELYFTPDRFEVSLVEEEPAYPGEHLMVRGAYPPSRTAFVLPPLAHC
jgi:GNAT superfamily N-acetyltransferase